MKPQDRTPEAAQPAFLTAPDCGLRTLRITVSAVREDTLSDRMVSSPDNVCRFWEEVIAVQPDHEADKENLVVLLLDVRQFPFAWNRVSLGSLTEASAHPREILRPLIVGGAHGFVLIHNHPSGDCSPSAADQAVTNRIRDAASLIQIHLHDHVIIGRHSPVSPGYFSFREHGML